jgi:uncharacterized protein YndB with AHSA1/START domain
MNTDRIEKKILLRAPLERVWRALSDSAAFGTWFGARFDGPFTPGGKLHGVIVGTAMDAEIAKAQAEHAGLGMEIRIEEVEPMRLLSFRWHPAAVERGVDYSGEPATLVEFRLEETGEGVMLTLSESGFDRLPPERRVNAFRMNEQGWGLVLTLVEKYLAHAG